MKFLLAGRLPIGQHIVALLGSFALVAIVLWVVLVDRDEPVEFLNGSIIPDPAIAGQSVTVRWRTNWIRKCEGITSREVVGSDKIVRAYKKEPARIPVTLGRQVSDTVFMLATVPPGEAEYRGVLRFHECGFTSRWYPIDVTVPSLYFDVAGQ